MNTTWGRAAVGLSIAALMLGACGDGDDPGGTPTSTPSSSSASPSGSDSASPSATSSASPSTDPSVPAAARERTEAGAIAFLEFFYAEVNRGQMSPGTVDLFDYSDRDCIACKNLQGALQEYVDNEWSVKQRPVELHDVRLANEVTADRVIINFTFEQLPVDYYKGGASQGKLEAAKTKHAAALRWVNGVWQMYGMEEL